MTYYLPINSTSLAHYFVCACVKPAKYFENKPQDLQDRFKNALLLSSELGTNDTDCCIELVLTKDEERNLVPCGREFFLFPTPLPISRVKAIHFRDPRQLEQTFSNINMSAAFIPHSLAKVARFSDAGIDVVNATDKPVDKDYSEQLVMFDRILGALALMKTAKEPYMNYSENYASTLSFFNALVRNDLEKQGRQINEKFFGLFSRSGNFVKFIPYLEKKITKEDLDQIAAENNQRIERSYTKAINYDKLSGITYAFAILQSYGVGGEAATKKIDGLISNNFEDLKDGKAEGIALYYGYNRGYSVFSNCYGTQEIGRQNVKYLLESQLDYYTIESVYQFAFYGNTTSSQFPYIDAWCPRKNQRPKRKTDYMVLDTAFIGKKKPSVFSKEYLLGFLEEIKTFDFINTPLSSLVDKIRIRVADDTREEIEDAAETKFAEAEAKWMAKYKESQDEIDSLKVDIDSQNGIISDLQKRTEELMKENELLKSSSGLLREPEVKYGAEAKEQDQEDLPIGDLPVAETSSVVDSYTTGKKSNKTAKAKSGSAKSKGSSKPSKKSTGKVQIEGTDKEVVEPQSPVQEDVIKPSPVREDGLLPFESNE